MRQGVSWWRVSRPRHEVRLARDAELLAHLAVGVGEDIAGQDHGILGRRAARRRGTQIPRAEV